jgi:glyoxylase-like metal-dependent hydrolase (beta-lactamase superfamily II)
MSGLIPRYREAGLRDLIEQHNVDEVQLPFELALGVRMELTEGHSPGHAALWVRNDAVFIGPLAISPIEGSAGIMAAQYVDPQTAYTVLERELAWAIECGALVIGPLWPGTGAGRVTGPPWQIDQA